jgi:hypothetical protein
MAGSTRKYYTSQGQILLAYFDHLYFTKKKLLKQGSVPLKFYELNLQLQQS